MPKEENKFKAMIQKTLDTYKPKIDAERKTELSTSTYKVDKPWGHEIWLEVNEFYTMKLIHMKEGNRSSLQSHEMKYETNIVVQGEAEVQLDDENGNLKSETFKAGEGWSVPVGRRHRVIANTDYTAIECSTSHLDDVFRYQDDTNRPSGKIESEHK